MKSLALLLLAAAASSCTLIPTDIVSVEARAIVVDDAEGDLDGLGEADIDLTGYGLHVALMTPVVDVVAGIDQREFESSDTPELDLGLRKRLIDVWKLHLYIEANLRYGFDLDTGAVSEDYFGYAAGFGALFDVTETLFINARIMYDTTDIDTGITDVDVDGLIGTIGIGFKI